MSRRLREEETRLWSLVLEDVAPRPGRRRPEPPPAPAPAPAAQAKAAAAPAHARAALTRPRPSATLPTIEPNRARRIAIGRETLERRLDLHGMSQDQARSVLERFVAAAWHDGARAVLVITGKGLGGDGILRRRTPEWLAEPPLRPMVAGVDEARHRHGGKGALYVALKRMPDGTRR